VFRTLSGCIQLQSNASPDLLALTASDASVAILVVAGMAIGFAVPMRIRDALVSVRRQADKARN
jgi:hypothetical protein